jgi:hypothetical protein
LKSSEVEASAGARTANVATFTSRRPVSVSTLPA